MAAANTADYGAGRSSGTVKQARAFPSFKLAHASGIPQFF
jgi:hypothetical protein